MTKKNIKKRAANGNVGQLEAATATEAENGPLLVASDVIETPKTEDLNWVPGGGDSEAENGNGVLETPETQVNELVSAEGLEDETFANENASIKSTDGLLDATKDDLDNLDKNIEEGTENGIPEAPSEQELNPDLSRFMTACQLGDMDRVKDYISTGKVAANDAFSDGITGLHWACINNRLSLVRYLVENPHSRANANVLGGELRASPLHWACRNGLVYIVDYLLKNSDADPTLVDSQSYNALHLAVHSSNIPLIIYLLYACTDPQASKTLYVDEPDASNRTCLHWAAYQGDLMSVNALLKFGADVNKVDSSLFIPLHWAFMRGYKSVLKALVDADSNIDAKNDQGKNSFDVAKDMNCHGTWIKVLQEAGRDALKNWAPRRPFLSEKNAKIITFFTPYVALPLLFEICSFSAGYAIPKLFAGLGVFAMLIYIVQKVVVPAYLLDDKPLPKTPLLAGIFSGTAFWCVVITVLRLLPTTLFTNFFSNLTLLGLIGVFSWSFFKAMFINPGFVPTPSDNSVVLGQINDLIREGKFDTDNFCVNSFVRIPLRSRYSRFNRKLVARFDHYCPWVYNEIGVRNHKLFMTFVYSLFFAIIYFSYLSTRYFDAMEEKSGFDSDDESQVCSFLSDKLCVGYKFHHFHFNLLCWSLMQFVWIVSLVLVQTFQILRGVTTWEFSLLNNKLHSPSNHSTVPRDFSGNLPAAPPTTTRHRHSSGLATCTKLTGLDQLFLTVKLAVQSLLNMSSGEHETPLDSLNIPTDYGLKQNWLDFWFLGEVSYQTLFYLPIEGENNLNGQVVDYYKLYEYPAKVSGAQAV